MTTPPQSPSSPKKPRRIQPKIVGHTAPTPRAPAACRSLRAITPVTRAPAVRPPVGAPGMRDFPRARVRTVSRAGNSVARALREQAARDQAAAAPTTVLAAPQELVDAPKPPPRKPSRNHRNAPARPAVTGRPTTPDEAPMNHAPAADRPALPTPRTAQTRPDPTHRAAQARHRLELRQEPSRPRPSRVLAEMHAAIADEAAIAE